MTKVELMEIRKYIEKNIGFLTPAEMMKYYEMFMHGADGYLLGAEFDTMIYGFYCDEIPMKYCSCQTDHKTNNQYLRFRPHGWGAQEIATKEDSICFGSIDYVYSLYTCNTKKGYNSGYCFEKAVFEKYNMADKWEQNNQASTVGGDITLNGKEIQIKFAEKGSLATITSTSKILRQIDKILKLM